MKKNTVFLIGPDNNDKELLSSVAIRIENRGFNVESPVSLFETIDIEDWSEKHFHNHIMHAVLVADLVVFMDGWEKSKVCNMVESVLHSMNNAKSSPEDRKQTFLVKEFLEQFPLTKKQSVLEKIDGFFSQLAKKKSIIEIKNQEIYV